MVQNEKTIKAIKGLINMLESFERATSLLSKHGVNLYIAEQKSQQSDYKNYLRQGETSGQTSFYI